MRLLLLLVALLFPVGLQAAQLEVSAAMGTRELVLKLGKMFEERTGNRVVFNFSSSGKLARQVESGAPADVYISASKFWMDYLIKKGIVDSVFPFAGTELVLVAPKGSKLKSLKEAERIAVGDRLAPVGMYALQTLRNLGILDEVKGKLVFAPNVRQITVWVITGNADAGIIYYSDYLKFRKRLRLVRVFPETSHDPIRFYIGLVRSSSGKKVSREFESFLLSQDEKVYSDFGFFKVKGGM